MSYWYDPVLHRRPHTLVQELRTITGPACTKSIDDRNFLVEAGDFAYVHVPDEQVLYHLTLPNSRVETFWSH